MKLRKTLTRTALGLITVMIVLSMVFASHLSPVVESVASPIKKLDGSISANIADYLNSSVVYQLPDTIKGGDRISVIVQLTEDCLLEAYQTSDTKLSFTEYAKTAEADAIRARIAAEKQAVLESFDKDGIEYELGADYDAVMSGFEIIITASRFESTCKSLGNRGRAIVGEVYNAAETKLVENLVNVYETGIFNSSEFGYDGTGIVVAVLDTGLDYDHTAFALSNFTADRSKLGLTFDMVADRLADTKAAGYESNLTASDVYISEKVPFAYDYADLDSDVFPLANYHGTHVAGIIAGKDDVITGVAPNAQLMIMKTFSDVMDSARSAWILSALNDCVVMGVDVINMSLGTSCGFSREMDKEAIDGVYDRIRDAGISLVVAASNSFNSTYGSEKNGNLGLTSNPDSATVGSPGTYNGALSVASINGAKTPYLLYNGTIIYFIESTDRVSEEKNFFEELLGSKKSMEIEYVTIPGVGRSADYTGIDVKGKIALVRRGSTTFEEKAAVAQQQGAAGMIVYNNVSGEIKMNVGEATIPVVSIRQDDGELLAASPSGTLKVDVNQASGPFMSDFSSWGPTPDLGIKPEITAHGGLILSAMTGQEYDRISGTSMACPNIAGVSALLRQYVKESPLFASIAHDPKEVTAVVNRLLMSTADIVYNTNGLPYAVRKQGAGLANLNNSAATTAYILTYDRVNGSIMDKSKIELGDDPQKTGIYSLKFAIQNFGATTLSYDLSAHVMTEGVSDTKTNDGKTTVTEQGYTLSGASIAIASISGGTRNGNTITVQAGQTAELTVTITLSDADKAYLDASFENGMYVEGFLMLNNKAGATAVDLSVPYLAFYGDWTVAPIFDLDFYATNKDELDDAIDLLDKTLPDAYATRPIGGLSDDYVSYLGSYYFEQDPSATKIAADRKYISLSNQPEAVNSLRFVWAGLLRNAKRIDITIVDDATGETVFQTTEHDVRKSYGDGGSIYPANVDIEFSALEHNLKNNTSYTVTLKSYLDYGDGGGDTNRSNVFTFPLVTDFEAPTVTGCEFYTEYDKSSKKTRLFAKVAVYDNHYAMSALVGYVDEEYVLTGLDRYLTPIFSEFNSTSYVVYELTDHIYALKQNALDRQKAGIHDYNYSPTFTISCYDYAMNTATYEIALPDEFTDVYFEEEETGLTLNPNETYALKPLVYPNVAWNELLTYNSSNASVARVVNNKIIAVAPGDTIISARDPNTLKTVATFNLHVRGEGEEGYVKYDKPVTDSFYLTGYYVNKAFYQLASEDRKIGATGDERKFSSTSYYALSMYPSESVTLRYQLDAYFPKDTTVEFSSSNDNIVTVSKDGRITAVAEGFATIAVRVMMDGKTTFYSRSINITVNEPYITSGPSLSHYFGLGGRVTFPSTLAITQIGDYAFSNFDYIPKDENDEISEEEPGTTKIWFIGDSGDEFAGSRITEIIIPEGVESIGAYAFANLTELKSVTLPSTLKSIEQGAFYGCTSLETVNGIGNVKLINRSAFQGCKLKGTITLDNAIAIADYAFADNRNLEGVVLSERTKSVASYAFANNVRLKSVTINADKIKLGAYAFSNCRALPSIEINAAVIPAGAFYGCTTLKQVTIGRDVAVIGEFAFGRSGVSRFELSSENTAFLSKDDGRYLTDRTGTKLEVVAPAGTKTFTLSDPSITTVAIGAFSGNTTLQSVSLPYVTVLEDFAFADCTALSNVTFGKLQKIGSYAFYKTALRSAPAFDGLDAIGDYAFAESRLTAVVIPNGMKIGDGAFQECAALASVTIGDNVTIGRDAFRRENLMHISTDSSVKSYYDEDGRKLYYIVYDSPIHSLTIGNNAVIGEGAFYGAAELTEIKLGSGAVIGDFAFYNASSLEKIDLSGAISIGQGAFSGDILYEFLDPDLSVYAYDEDYAYIFRYYAPRLTSVDLSSATHLGEQAFALCRELESVKLGKNLKLISMSTFQMCEKLTAINLENVEVIGEMAFYMTDLRTIDLSSAIRIDAYAFAYNEALTSVVLGANGTDVGNGAFSDCPMLRTLHNLEKAPVIGDYAFSNTAITEADLTAATYIGTHAFQKKELTAFRLTLGDKIEDMGDNPFAMCIITPLSSTVTESFNGKEYTATTYTFDINDVIRVIDGSIYRIVPNGLELITYTGTADDYTVADGTVRVSAMAFAGSNVGSVVLPKSLVSVGHKAFYACDKLKMVVFTSYNAPILEEEYDESYYSSLTNIPATGIYDFSSTEGEDLIYTGLGIAPYYMWNAASDPSNVFYGANFVNYIGHIKDGIVLVSPTNGQNYDSFIWNQYFDTFVKGAAAPDKTTQAAIDAINRLPSKLSLADKALVEAARAAYDLVSSLEQRALITNYLKLTQAEQQISDLEYLQNGPAQTPPDAEEPAEPTKKLETLEILCIALGALLAVAVVLVIIFAVRAKKAARRAKRFYQKPAQVELARQLRADLQRQLQKKSGNKPGRG